MKTPHPAPFESIPLSRQDWFKVAAATMNGKQDWEIVQEAIDEWMRRHAPEECGEPEFAGYQWKSLFLPEGTVLRTVFKGKNHHCRVEVDQISYQGQACSPSGFVNAVGGVRRNAWKSVWLLFPDSKHWQLADTLRAPKRPVAARRTHPARPIKVAPTAKPSAAPPAPPAQERSTQFMLPLAIQYRWKARLGSSYAADARSAASKPSEASSMKSSTRSKPLPPP